MAHYTCVNASRRKIISDIAALKSVNIENLMLLRGDPPKGSDKFVAHPEGFSYASELIETVNKEFGNYFSVGSGCYPEKHPEAASIDEDIRHLKVKYDAGTDFLITQLFFDSAKYFAFVRKAYNAGIRCRIIPGIIPLTNYGQINRFAQMSGTSIPQDLAERIESSKDNPKLTAQIGVDHAVALCRDLLAGGASGIHFYTLNKSGATIEIFETVKGF